MCKFENGTEMVSLESTMRRAEILCFQSRVIDQQCYHVDRESGSVTLIVQSWISGHIYMLLVYWLHYHWAGVLYRRRIGMIHFKRVVIFVINCRWWRGIQAAGALSLRQGTCVSQKEDQRYLWIFWMSNSVAKSCCQGALAEERGGRGHPVGRGKCVPQPVSHHDNGTGGKHHSTLCHHLGHHDGDHFDDDNDD